ncbi:uncharacterized protein LOC143183719 isoform X1 [Calliopsis andreniformis]|uniref:uncharacterized protein LOC143183719 isoform X1 n=1 Tax=Calliopsis andreniformis TaxID=337506 RepID=UPI003FCE2046
MKRSRSLSPKSSSSEEDMKHIKLGDNAKADDTVSHPHILDFSDDVLLNIFKYLSPQDLMAISLCCQRLSQIARDKTLWRIVDFRGSPMVLNDLKKYMKFLQPMTTTLAIRANSYSEKDAGLSPWFFNSIKSTCTQLKELIIEEYYINADKIHITDFPRTIKKFSLKGCKMGFLRSNKSYFFNMNFHMFDLTCLILSNCQWLTPHSLLGISKMPNLKELRLNSCHSLGECVAYAGLATRFGFKKLEILDLRDTALSDSEVGFFNYTKTLTHLYLEYPSSLQFPVEHEAQPLQREDLDEPVYEDGSLAEFLVSDEFRWANYVLGRGLVTDRAICTFGSSACIHNVEDGLLELKENILVFNKPNLKTLVVRRYPYVTNSSLVHLALNVPSLEYLDVTGTSVTRQGVETFKSQKPNVKIVSSFDET